MYSSVVHHLIGFTDTGTIIKPCNCVCCFGYARIIQVTGYNGLWLSLAELVTYIVICICTGLAILVWNVLWHQTCVNTLKWGRWVGVLVSCTTTKICTTTTSWQVGGNQCTPISTVCTCTMYKVLQTLYNYLHGLSVCGNCIYSHS